MDKLFVIFGGLGLIGFIWWFFFGKNDTAVVAGDVIDILVDGGYKPENIKIKKGRVTKLIFKRTDPNSCLEEIVIPDFKIKKYLPLNQKIEINLAPEKEGIYQIHCGMNMFHGKVVVE
ncbi:MAG TPA: cupredoxin domain-containing protein [Alphaproteobacteria bacterium]|jgi:plastocyanin domain-containing protein|nr:cupredoxin domain-containing protein [Alphaproteobacteria bacterium]